MKFILALFIVFALIISTRAGGSSCKNPESLFGNNINSFLLLSTKGATLELGTKFSSRTGGVVSGIRFLKAEGDNSYHKGHLWENGNKITSVSFHSESRYGWQQANLDNPVAIVPEKDYIVSVNVEADNNYAVGNNFFTNDLSSYDNNLVSHANEGVYGVGSDTYPIFNYAHIFFRDVVFVPFESLFPDVQSNQIQKTKDSAYDLGTKFKSTKNGKIYAIRFYKVQGDSTTTHKGKIWGASTSPLVNQNFPNNLPIGWNTLYLDSPLQISANTYYTVSVNVDSGSDYAYIHHYFDNAKTEGDLHMDAGAGVYTSTESGKPTSVYENNSYFRDVLFAPDECSEGGTY